MARDATDPRTVSQQKQNQPPRIRVHFSKSDDGTGGNRNNRHQKHQLFECSYQSNRSADHLSVSPAKSSHPHFSGGGVCVHDESHISSSNPPTDDGHSNSGVNYAAYRGDLGHQLSSSGPAYANEGAAHFVVAAALPTTGGSAVISRRLKRSNALNRTWTTAAYCKKNALSTEPLNFADRRFDEHQFYHEKFFIDDDSSKSADSLRNSDFCSDFGSRLTPNFNHSTYYSLDSDVITSQNLIHTTLNNSSSLGADPTMIKGQPPNIKQLSVPEIRIRSHSTPNSPDSMVTAACGGRQERIFSYGGDPHDECRTTPSPLYKGPTFDTDGKPTLKIQSPHFNSRKHSCDSRGPLSMSPTTRFKSTGGSDTQLRSASYDQENDVTIDHYILHEVAPPVRSPKGSTIRRRLPPTPDQLQQPAVIASNLQVVVSPPQSMQNLCPNRPQSPQQNANGKAVGIRRPQQSYQQQFGSNLNVSNSSNRKRSGSLQMNFDDDGKIPGVAYVGADHNERPELWDESTATYDATLRRRGTGRKLPKPPDMVEDRMNAMSYAYKFDPHSRKSLETPKSMDVRPQAVVRPLNDATSQQRLQQRRASEQSIEQYVKTSGSGVGGKLHTPERLLNVGVNSVKPSTLGVCRASHFESRSSSDTEDQGGLSSMSSLSSALNFAAGTCTDTTSKTSDAKMTAVADDSSPPGESLKEGASTTTTGSPTHQAKMSSVSTSVASLWPSSEDLAASKLALPADNKNHGLGELFFAVQYFPVRKRLRVFIHRADGLAGEMRPDLELSTFAKVCLMPGKNQKQHGGRLVKATRNAVYNEEFFFDNIAESDVFSFSLKIKICHRVSRQFQKDVAVGEVDEPLSHVTNLMSKREIKIRRFLKLKQIKKLGKIRLSTCLEIEARRLTINILKVDDLPKFGISGAPDPLVKITLDQNGRIQSKQTRMLKSTCSASFKESVMFLVSVRQDDLDRADIEIAVLDASRMIAGGSSGADDEGVSNAAANDAVIGYVYLGLRAQDRAEQEQWKNTVANPGKEMRGMHTLRPKILSGAGH